MLRCVARNVNMVDVKILSQGFSSWNTMFCTLNVRIILPIDRWIRSNMELACEFFEVIHFALMQ